MSYTGAVGEPGGFQAPLHFPDMKTLKHPKGLEGYREIDGRVFKAVHKVTSPEPREQQMSIAHSNATIDVMFKEVVQPLRKLKLERFPDGAVDSKTAEQVDAIMERITQIASKRSIAEIGPEGRLNHPLDPLYVHPTSYKDIRARVANCAATLYRDDFALLARYIMKKHHISGREASALLLEGEGCLAKSIALETCGRICEDAKIEIRQMFRH
jgi:hypothetical protein